MSELEERLRATVRGRSADYEPSDDLADRIDARVRHGRLRGRLVAGTLVAAAATLVVVATVALVGVDRGRDGTVRTVDPSRTELTPPGQPPTTQTSTTEGGPASSGSTVSTSTSVPDSVSGPTIDLLTPLSRLGIGPVAAGMTLREAQAVAGVTITPIAPTAAVGNCIEARITGSDVSLIVEPAGPGADAMDGTVRAAVGSVAPTDEGAIVGQSRQELLAALGEPTRREDRSALLGAGAELLVFETDGGAYGATVVDDMVLSLQSGDPAWVGADDGCPA